MIQTIEGRSKEILGGNTYLNVVEFIHRISKEIQSIPSTVECSINLRIADLVSKEDLFQRMLIHLNASKVDLGIRVLTEELFVKNSEEYSGIVLLDKMLVSIANSDIEVGLKKSFFSNFGAEVDKLFEEKISEKYLGVGGINDVSTCPLPIEVSYVLNIEDVRLKSLGISEVRKLFALNKDVEGSLRGAKIKIVRMEEAIIEAGTIIARNIGTDPSLLDSTRFPREKLEWKLTELFIISRGEILSSYDECLASLQLLRLYRELVNTKIAANSFTAQLISFQENRDYEKFLDRYVGNDAGVNRSHKFYSRFMYMHFGLTLVDQLSDKMVYKNDELPIVPIPSTLMPLLTGSQTVELSLATRTVVDKFLLEHSDLVETYKNFHGEKVSIEIALKFINEVLSRLGLKSDEEQSQIQLDHYIKGEKLGQIPTTLAIYMDPKNKALAMNSEYGILRFPVKNNYTWSRLVEIVVMHEISHFYQKLSARELGIPGVDIVGGLGRSGVLGESGAIKMQSLAQIIRSGRNERTVGANVYHLTGLLKVLEGGNFWEAFNSVWEFLPMEDRTFSLAYRRLMRVYNNIGATSAASQTDMRFPSSYGLLEYMLQGTEEYTDLPYYISSIPSDKWMEFIGFFSKPSINPTDMLFIALDSMKNSISGS